MLHLLYWIPTEQRLRFTPLDDDFTSHPMNISAPFINRPIATSLLAIGIMIAGILSFYLLPVAPLPQVEFPIIMVQAAMPGASPEIMASSIASPIERQLTRIAGISDMTSSSSLGQARIIIQFDLSRNIDGAARDVESAINASLGDLPANIPSHPSYKKLNPADAPIMIFALTSDHFPIDKLFDYASTQLQQKILQIDGVGQVIIGGSSLPAIRVELNPHKINKYGIGISDIKSVIDAANTNSAKGQIVDKFTISEISMNDQLSKAEDYANLIISYKNGSALRLKDVAEVKDSVQDIRNSGSLNGDPAVFIVIFKQPGANIIETVDKIEDSSSAIRAMIPADINLKKVMDRTTTIKASLWDIEKTLLISMGLVTLVVYVFLGNFRAMLIPAIAMIVSFLGTFTAMQLLGFSLNNLSLMAISISTGFVVDDAIVVLENISRYVEKGVKPKEAALKGAKEIAFTVTSITISLIAVFIPLLFMGGIVGRLFREFAVTIGLAVGISLLVSLTLTPVMCSRFLRPIDHKKDESWLKRFYERTLRIALEHQKIMLIATIATIIFSIFLFITVPKGFFPQQDTGIIVSSIIADQDTSYKKLKENFDEFIKIIKQDPGVKNAVGFIGSNSNNSGSVYIILKPLEERKLSADEIIAKLRGNLDPIASSTLYMQAIQDLSFGGRQSTSQFQYTITADNIEDVNNSAKLIMEKIKKIPGIADVNSDQKEKGLESYVKIDYNKAAKFGVTIKEIDDTLYGAFGQSLASTIYADLNQYYVVLEVAPEYWKRPEILKSIYVKGASGTLVPLVNFASFERGSTLLAVNHQGLAPSATLSFNVLPGTPLGNVVDELIEEVDSLTLPITVQGAFRGTAQAFKSSMGSEIYLIITALLAVYIVLGMLYENLIHPLTILSTLPSAGVGALLSLIITRTDLTIIAIIGIILLIGIVKKNAIMMIDFVIEIKKHEKISSKEAIYQAATLRFRPIMMTSMAALLGAVPLALGTGVGAELRRPLGIAIIGGLVVSQMLTLYTTPVMYLAMERLGKRFKK